MKILLLNQCFYPDVVATAQQLRLRFITVDNRLLQAFPGTAISIEQFVSGK